MAVSSEQLVTYTTSEGPSSRARSHQQPGAARGRSPAQVGQMKQFRGAPIPRCAACGQGDGKAARVSNGRCMAYGKDETLATARNVPRSPCTAPGSEVRSVSPMAGPAAVQDAPHHGGRSDSTAPSIIEPHLSKYELDVGTEGSSKSVLRETVLGGASDTLHENSANTLTLPLGALADPTHDQSRTEHIIATPTPHALADSALRKSEALLDEIAAFDFGFDVPQGLSSPAQDSMADLERNTPTASMQSSFTLKPVETVTLPIEVLNMMVDTLAQMRDLQEKVATGSATCRDAKFAATSKTLELVGRALSNDSETDSLLSSTDTLASIAGCESPSVQGSASSCCSPTSSVISHPTLADLHTSEAWTHTPRKAAMPELPLMTAPPHVIRQTPATASSPMSSHRRSSSPAAAPGLQRLFLRGSLSLH